jgi:PAS domain S-box-containing protein
MAMEYPADEIKNLKACINDLITVLALPAIWTGREPSDIISTLLDVLLGMLRLDFAYARVSNSTGAEPLEIVQLARAGNVTAQPQEIGHILKPWLRGDPPKSSLKVPNPSGEGEVLIAALPLGLQDAVGVLVAASQRSNFPTETERLLLQVAANQAAIGLEEARRMTEQRRLTEELDQRVTQRTTQLTSVNEDLRKENVERKRAEALLRGEKRLLEMIAKGNSVSVILDALCRLVEELSKGSLCSILLLDPDGKRLWHGAAPSLPKSYIDAIDGASIGPAAGSCGTAAYRKEPVIVSDIAEDPLWANYRDLALPHGLRACWSTPILASDGTVLGTFAIYYREPRTPTPAQQNMIEQITNLANIAIERKQAEEERQAHLAFLESMDQVNRAIQGTNDLEQMMSDVLDAVLAIFDCDRAWLVYPCDPEAASWKVPMEHVRPQFPGAFALGSDLPVTPEVVRVFKTVRASDTPLCFGPGSKHPLPAEAAAGFSIQSMIGMAVYPKGDKPYMLGLHQCSYSRVWTSQEERLFQEIGRRLEDALTSLLMFRNLGESERKLEDAQHLTHVGYWERDTDTDFITWSDESYRIFGLKPGERILHLSELPELIHPEDREIMVGAVADALKGVRRYDVEYRVIRPSGEVRYVHSRGEVIRDESGRARRMFGSVQDITERKQAEKRLMAQHKITAMLAEAATFEEVIPKILQAVCDFLSWDVGTLWSIDREADLLRCIEVWHKQSVQIPEFEEFTRERPLAPGIGLPGRVWASREPAYIPDVAKDANFVRGPIAAREGLHAVLAFPIMLGTDVLGVMEFFSHEIRQPEQELLEMMATLGSQIGQFIERKRAEDALHHARTDLAHVTRVATLGEMSASIAHEINQPLAAVVNNASACLRWLAAQNLEAARESATRVISDGHRAGEIIGRIRALTKKAPPQKDWLDINEIIREVIALAQSEVQRNGVVLETRLSDDVHYLPLILADRIQLQQVILNLIMNAIEAMSGVGDGPRELLVRSGTAESQRVLVAVRDSGPGLDPKSLNRLFDAFYTTKPQGLGMGLAISRSIIDAHGGRLWAIANDDRGATFQFTLPTGGERTS